MWWITLYVIGAFAGLYVIAKWLGVIINIGLICFLAVMTIVLIALSVAP